MGEVGSRASPHWAACVSSHLVLGHCTGVSQRRGPNAWVREVLKRLEPSPKCEVGTAIITGTGRVHHLLSLLGGGGALPKESLQSVLAPLQSQETPNKTRVAWAEAHGQGSFTSVYTAGSTPNCLLCDSLHGRLCLDHDRRSGSLHSQSLSPRMTFPVPS